MTLHIRASEEHDLALEAALWHHHVARRWRRIKHVLVRSLFFLWRRPYNHPLKLRILILFRGHSQVPCQIYFLRIVFITLI